MFSSQETQSKKRKVGIDDEDEYVLNDDELEAENDDGKLEDDDDEDAVPSDEEKDDIDKESVEEEDEEEEEEEEHEDDKDGDSKPTAAVAVSEVVQDSRITATPASPAIKSAVPAVYESVIKEPVSDGPTGSVESQPHHQQPHRVYQRHSPAAGPVTNVALPPLSIDAGGSQDKRKRPPTVGRPDKSSPNPAMEYPYPFQAAPNAAAKIPPTHTYRPPPAPVPQGPGFNKATVATTASSFRSNKFPADPPPPSAYLPTSASPPVVQQVFNPVPPVPATTYSYPVDYAPPPPPTVAFRNVTVSGPPHETSLPLPPVVGLHPPPTQASGDSEFGGLVSYFSSQQEDDFDAWSLVHRNLIIIIIFFFFFYLRFKYSL